MRFSLPALCLAALILAGCGKTAQPPFASDTAGRPFDPVAFFDGHTQSWGVIENRSGAPTEQIVTDTLGVPEGNDRLRMVQHLSFQNGTKQTRDWTVWRSGAGQYDATANDMIGTAKGQVDGNMFHWHWVLARSPGNALMNVTMNQWMYRLSDGSVMIRTTVTKFGVIVAEVSEQFVRRDKQS